MIDHARPTSGDRILDRGPTAPADAAPGSAGRIERRLAAMRAARPAGRATDLRALADRADDRAARLAQVLDGELIRSARGLIVRRDCPVLLHAPDRADLATLPGHPGPDRPLVCLDTETTGLATAAGTLAFLVGLGWWEGQRFRSIQLLLADPAHEPALLDAIEAGIPRDAWLVTYNGRGFDWPLLKARFRLARRAAPPLDGHLDLLGVVRRLIRHRLTDARLPTVERELLAIQRPGSDVPGWEIPARYYAFLQDDDPRPLVEVARHNERDVATLAILLEHLAARYGRPGAWADAHEGDLLRLARSFRREQRHEEALACLDAALGAHAPAPCGATQRSQLVTDRARTLLRLGRTAEAAAAWLAMIEGGGPDAIVGSVELAKLHEHRHRDPHRALAVTRMGLGLAQRRRQLGRPQPLLERDLEIRRVRLERRISRAAGPAG